MKNWTWNRQAKWRYLYVEVSPVCWSLGITLFWGNTSREFSIAVGPFGVGINYKTAKLRRALRR